MGVALPFPSETFLSGRCFAPPSEKFRKKVFKHFSQKLWGAEGTREKCAEGTSRQHEEVSFFKNRV
jgi:hypothetical protein